MIIEKERDLLLQKIMLVYLTHEIEVNDFSVLSKLYDMSNIDNDVLIRKAHSIRAVVDSPDRMIYYDMVYCIVDKTKESPTIFQDFNELLKNKYHRKYAEYERLLDLWKKGKDWVEFYMTTYAKNPIVDVSLKMAILYFPLFYKNMEFVNLIENSYLETVKFCSYAYNTYDIDTIDKAYTFNTGENIFESIQFERYLEKRKAELAEFVSKQFNEKADSDSVCDVIGKLLKTKATKERTKLSLNIDFIPTGVTRRTIIDHFGGATWYTEVTTDKKGGYKTAKDYNPDVENIVRSYYREYIKRAFSCCKEKGNTEFSKIYMSRECIPESVAESFNAIMYMYNLDVMCWMFNQIKDKYYKNFSWEKVTCQDLSFRYNQIISELQDSINSLNNKLVLNIREQQKIREELRTERHIDDKSENAAIISLEQEVGRLNKKIDDKDDEIVSLRRQLESKEEYIRILMSQEEDEIESEIDISLLQQKRYLFVGHIKEAIPELRRNFPNSIFMEEETTSINNIQVDGIVMLIKYMSHAMFYKVNSSGLLKEVPVVRCNTKNVSNIYRKMTELEV